MKNVPLGNNVSANKAKDTHIANVWEQFAVATFAWDLFLL